jgi:hypothetical protein
MKSLNPRLLDFLAAGREEAALLSAGSRTGGNGGAGGAGSVGWADLAPHFVQKLESAANGEPQLEQKR